MNDNDEQEEEQEEQREAEQLEVVRGLKACTASRWAEKEVV